MDLPREELQLPEQPRRLVSVQTLQDVSSSELGVRQVRGPEHSRQAGLLQQVVQSHQERKLAVSAVRQAQLGPESPLLLSLVSAGHAGRLDLLTLQASQLQGQEELPRLRTRQQCHQRLPPLPSQAV